MLVRLRKVVHKMDATIPKTISVLTQDQPCVYIIDDDADVRKSLHFLLASSWINGWPFASAADFIDQLPELAPAPVLLDLRMPTIDGLQVLAIMKDLKVDWPIVMMTAHGDVTTAVRAMKLGAIEFLEKPFQPEDLDHALTHAFGLLDLRRNSLRARDEARAAISRLTKREHEICAILMEGVANKIAAFRLGISVRTIELHRINAFRKLHIKSIPQFMKLFNEADL